MKKTKAELLVGILGAFAVLNVAGCGSKEASFDTVETMRSIAKQNAEYNAKAWRGMHPEFQGWGLIVDGDSTISPSCPQGDGWASLSLTDPKNPSVKAGIKCSTYSGNIQCMLKKDFVKKKSYNQQEGACNEDVPMPIPKINK